MQHWNPFLQFDCCVTNLAFHILFVVENAAVNEISILNAHSSCIQNIF